MLGKLAPPESFPPASGLYAMRTEQEQEQEASISNFLFTAWTMTQQTISSAELG